VRDGCEGGDVVAAGEEEVEGVVAHAFLLDTGIARWGLWRIVFAVLSKICSVNYIEWLLVHGVKT
jgi:hypothetical protein